MIQLRKKASAHQGRLLGYKHLEKTVALLRYPFYGILLYWIRNQPAFLHQLWGYIVLGRIGGLLLCLPCGILQLIRNQVAFLRLWWLRIVLGRIEAQQQCQHGGNLQRIGKNQLLFRGQVWVCTLQLKIQVLPMFFSWFFCSCG